MNHPARFFLCRVKLNASNGPGYPHEVLSTHGYVWAEHESQANRMVLDTRTPVLPHPKGRPPADTELVMLEEAVLRAEFPAILAAS